MGELAARRRTRVESASGAAVRVRVIMDDCGFDELAPAWARLHQAMGGSAFESFEWQRNWWRHFGGAANGCNLRLLLVESCGTVVGIAPLMIRAEKVLGSVRLHTLQFLAPDVSDYLGILCEDGSAEDVAGAVASALPDLKFDVLILRDLRDRTGVCALLLDRLKTLHWAASREPGERCPVTRLGDTWEATLKTFASSHRKKLSYLQRRLGKEFAVEFHQVKEPSELDAALSTLMDLHQQHWVGVAFSGAFHDEAHRRFHLETARAFLTRGWLVLGFLRLNHQVAASIYAFKIGKSLQFYLSGRGATDQFVKYSPGIAIHLYCMQEMIAEGVREYDFLRGTEAYKYTLGAEDFETWRLLAFPPRTRVARWKYTLSLRLHDFVAGAKALRRSLRRPRAGSPGASTTDEAQGET
ncbi:MAG: GNAT family N-acetyltransferase [Dehalococcoidia bacterium]